jgi:hypothetical protein
MLHVKLLGANCRRCQLFQAEVEAVLQATRTPYSLEKVTDYAQIADYGVLQLPALVIGEQIFLVGCIPSREKLREWLHI